MVPLSSNLFPQPARGGVVLAEDLQKERIAKLDFELGRVAVAEQRPPAMALPAPGEVDVWQRCVHRSTCLQKPTYACS